MLVVAVYLGRAPVMCFHQNSSGYAGQSELRSVVFSLARDESFDGARMRQDLLFGTAAGGQAGKPKGGGHQLQDGAARTLVECFRGSACEFAVDPIAEFRFIVQLAERTPIL